MKFKVLFVSFFLVCFQVLGQVDVPSPQTADFVRYGNVPVNHYTGTLGLSIPLYQYKDRDFDLDINLSYNSEGFKPNKRSSAVGLNWFLNVGGVITRNVAGTPDDLDQYENTTELKPSGFYVLSKQKDFKNRELPLLTQGLSDLKATALYSYNGTPYEVEPDEFSFNFMGVSGKFYIDIEGNARVVSSHRLKVDLSGFAIQPNVQSHWEIKESEIKITDSNGYCYTFGGQHEYLEYSFGFRKGGTAKKKAPSVSETGHRIVSWYLKEVLASNGRKMTFKYSELKKPEIDFQVEKSNYYQLNISHYRELYFSKKSGQGAAPEGKTVSITKPVYLKSIEIDDTNIDFSYSEKDHEFYTQRELGGSTLDEIEEEYSNPELQLDNITVSKDEYERRSISFTYRYLGNSGATRKRHFLSSVRVKGMPAYKFHYNTAFNFPYPSTLSIDHWSYWNGGNSLSRHDLIPQYTLDQNHDVTYSGTKRKPSFTYSKAGLLYKVEYPTKGWSEFTYEPHNFSSVLDRRSAGNFLPKLYNETGVAGGARVAAIKDCSESGSCRTKQLKYVKDYSSKSSASSLISSGVLQHKPRYVLQWETEAIHNSGWSGLLYYSINISADTRTWLSGKSLSTVNYHDNYICYPEVVEVLENGGYTKFHYSSYVSNPDFIDEWPIDGSNKNVSYFNTHLQYNDFSSERGKIQETNYYTKGDVPVKKVAYSYNDVSRQVALAPQDPHRQYRHFKSVRYVRLIPQVYKVILKNNRLIRKEATEYDKLGKAIVKTEESYIYNSYDQLARVSTKNSLRKGITKVMRYPQDFTSRTDIYDPTVPRALSEMIKRHIVGIPIETYTYCQSEVISAQLNTFKKDGDLIVPNATYSLNLEKPIESGETFNHKNIRDLSSKFNLAGIYFDDNEYLFRKDMAYDADIRYLTHDKVGNPTAIEKSDGIYEYYQWSYNNQYPVLKIVGAKIPNYYKVLSDVIRQATSFYPSADQEGIQSGLDLALTNNSDWGRFETYIRNKLGKTHLITTYTYAPLIGMTSQTDTNGKKTTYKYDSLGRLLTVSEGSSVVKEYHYHYKGETIK